MRAPGPLCWIPSTSKGFKEQRGQWLLLAALAAVPLFYFFTTLSRLPKMSSAGEHQIVLHRPKIIIFGDSLTERSFDHGGWGAALQHNYSRKADVLNRGFGGYNTRWALHLVDEVLLTTNPAEVRILTVLLGANDAAHPDRAGYRHHVPVQEYSTNLERILSRFQAAGIMNIIVMCPPPVFDDGRIRHQQERMGNYDVTPAPDRTLNNTAVYAAACKQVAAAKNLPCIDLFAKMQEPTGWQREFFVPDGLHLSAAGNQMVFKLLHNSIATAYPQLLPESLPWHFPYWDNINITEPGTTFKQVYNANHKPPPAPLAIDANAADGNND